MKKIIEIILTVSLLFLVVSVPLSSAATIVISNVIAQPGDMARYISIRVSNDKQSSLGFRLRYDPAAMQITAVRSFAENPNLLLLTNLVDKPFTPGNLSFGFADFSYDQLIEPGALREVGRVYFNIPANAKEGSYSIKVEPLTARDRIMVSTGQPAAHPGIFEGQLIITRENKLRMLENNF